MVVFKKVVPLSEIYRIFKTEKNGRENEIILKSDNYSIQRTDLQDDLHQTPLRLNQNRRKSRSVGETFAHCG